MIVQIVTEQLEDETWIATIAATHPPSQLVVWSTKTETESDILDEAHAIRVIKALALRTIASWIEDDILAAELPFEIVFTRCIHPPVEEPIGWTHCYKCDKSVPHD